MTHKLSSTDRGRIAEKVMEWGNWVFAVLVLGQILSTEINPLAGIGGLIVFVAAYYFAYRLLKRR